MSGWWGEIQSELRSLQGNIHQTKIMKQNRQNSEGKKMSPPKHNEPRGWSQS